MRLISAKISGYGRLVNVKINLDSKVIAVVGPNEAGKTTLLKALDFSNRAEPHASSDRSRKGPAITDDTEVVVLEYIVEPADIPVLGDIELDHAPERLKYIRHADGQGYYQIEPTPSRPREQLHTGWQVVEEFFSTEGAPLLEPDSGADDDIREFRRRTVEMLDQLKSGDPIVHSIDNSQITELKYIATALRELSLAPTSVTDSLENIAEWYAQEDVLMRQIYKALLPRTPQFVFFSQEHRELRSAYELNEESSTSPPSALNNIALLAELDIRELWLEMCGGLNGAVQTRIFRANTKLDKVFRDSWDQSDVSLHLNIDGTTLHVMILEDGDEITVFDERSAGLRMFTALRAFLATQNITRPVALLIDEAETHLHIDAQANLVNTFITQDAAAKIVYTTHSPACLPPDLGVGVRAVLPDPDKQGVSSVHNGFWTKGAGFSSLMLAMGAGAAAFTPARYVVLAEGASEMLLLPTLIRHAIGAERLEYQIAPGLSGAPLEIYPDLDLEAARVAFLVDGDEGGLNLRVGLTHYGVPDQRILTLGATTLENLLDPANYQQCIVEMLRECNTGKPISKLPKIPDIDGEARPKVLHKWAVARGLQFPSKVAVASALIERGLATTTAEGARRLIRLDQDIRGILRI